MKKKTIVNVDDLDIQKLAKITKMSIEESDKGRRLLVLAPKTIALSLAFIGFDSFIEVIVR
jgi:hypothetical protein